MTLHAKYKVASVQAAPIYLDTNATVDKVCKLVDEAAAEGAKLIAFPEAMIPGYPQWLWMRPAYDWEPFYKRLYDQAVTIPGPAISKLSDAARRNQVYYSISMTEREGMSLYLTQVMFDPQGNLLGKHRKFKASVNEKIIWADGGADLMPVYDTPLGKIGGAQCWNNAIPHVIAAYAAKGEQVHISAWPIYQDESAGHNLYGARDCEIVARYYAMATCTFSLMSTSIFTQEMIDMLCETDEQYATLGVGGGCTRIFAPNGDILASIPGDEEGIIYADIDLDDIIMQKYLNDPAGMYSFPKDFRLYVDQRPKKSVTFIGEGTDTSMSFEELQQIGNPEAFEK